MDAAVGHDRRPRPRAERLLRARRAPRETDQIKELLEAARDLWRTLAEVEEEGERLVTTRATFRLIHLADILAVTTSA